MQFIYHILLLVVCVGTFVDCKGGRGGGGGGRGSIGGRARYGGAGYAAAGYSGARYSGSHQKESKSCNTDQCQSERAIFGIIFCVGAPSIIFVLIVLCILCCKSDGRTNEKIDQHTNTTKYKGNCESNLQVNKKPLAIASNNDGTFNVNTSYTNSLNNYVTHEDYLYLLSIINPQLKQLMIYIIIISILSRDFFKTKMENIRSNVALFVRTFPTRRIASNTTMYSMWNIEFGNISRFILIVEPTSVCQKNDINSTTSTIPEMIDRTNNPSESIHYNPQLNTIITLEANK
ncbi:unnamed protein product [Adineta steineri]|uniref:Uncharacterized protein n=1 Tax=Adineta steineri TaxID=433720 RepID=A0A814P8T0_9BILA|nr:unnamed protein product [Adineta steineri]CAF1102350.1 unnamed protein product [Adineta steineri]